MKQLIVDQLAHGVLRAILALLNLFPLRLRLNFIATIIRLFTALAPRYRRVANKNLAIAFPDRSLDWRRSVLQGTYPALARVIVDFARLAEIDRAWIEQHVDLAGLDTVRRLKSESQGRGAIFVAGHLGSFELLAHLAPLIGTPLAVVARSLPCHGFDRYLTAVRQRRGNRVINRRGAFREIMQSLRGGVDIGILFDQNVTRKNAIFVDWFGKPAATTKSVGLAALRSRAKVGVLSLFYTGEERYALECAECDLADIYESENLGREEKVRQITQRLATMFQEQIKRFPEQWLWFHRRWKTRPAGDRELVYG